jgi:hypothetical protein
VLCSSTAIGVPSVVPSNTPDRISGVFGSRRAVSKTPEGFAVLNAAVKSSEVSGIPAGHPSTTTPIAAPWLSPNVVTLKIIPNVFPDMAVFYFKYVYGSISPKQIRNEQAVQPAFSLR